MGSSRRDDPIAAIEAVYELDGDHAGWTRGILNALAPGVDDGFGVVGQTYDISNPAQPTFGPVIAIGEVAGHLDVPEAMMMALPPEERVRMLRWCGGRTASQQFRMREREFLEHPASRDVWQPKGYADCLALNSCDVSGRGAYVAAPLKRPRWVTGARARRWTRIAAHFATGLRLRTALGVLAASTDLFTHGDAVLSPRGKIEHAERDAREKGAREALRSAAIAIDRARGSLRETPDHALASWAPLVSGRWSVVDRFDRDGRRYLIALPNAPHLDDPRALTAQERVVVAFASLGHTNKMIAYDLGVSVSRVGTLLSSAARKLGARSRVDLVTLASSLASQTTS